MGMLEPDMDNVYTREIGKLSKLMSAFEDEYLNILPLRQKSPPCTKGQGCCVITHCSCPRV